MSKTERLRRVAESLNVAPPPNDWEGVDAVLPILENFKEEGAVVVVKLDGQRKLPVDNGPYTIMISSPTIGGFCARTDSGTLKEGLEKVILEYAEWKSII